MNSHEEIKTILDWLNDCYVVMGLTPGGGLTFTCKETLTPALLPREYDPDDSGHPVDIVALVDKRDADLFELVRELSPREEAAAQRNRRDGVEATAEANSTEPAKSFFDFS